MEDVFAILCSDIHLRHRPPAARSAEPHWYDAQHRQLKQLRDLKEQHGCPVVIAGDLFDSCLPHKCPAELVNFAIAELPDCLAIPGQHDLVHHCLDDLRKSPFCTLMKSGRVTYLAPGQVTEIQSNGAVLRFRGFPWGTEVRPRTKDPTSAMTIDVAVIHAYVWKPGAGHAKADPKDLSREWRKRLAGYDVAHFGDNHQTVHTQKDGLTVWNPGGFFRSRIDERDHRPCVGLLKRDGTVEKHYLDVSQDKFLEPDQIIGAASDTDPADFEEVVELLSTMADSAADFEQAVRWAVDRLKPPSDVTAVILSSLDKTARRLR